MFPFTLKWCTEKKKERDEETEEMVPEDPPVSVPDEEVVVHKKVKLVNELHDWKLQFLKENKHNFLR